MAFQHRRSEDTTLFRSQSGAQNGEWRTYGGDLGNTHYSPLDQIRAGNFDQLQVAWRFNTADRKTRRSSDLNPALRMASGEPTAEILAIRIIPRSIRSGPATLTNSRSHGVSTPQIGRHDALPISIRRSEWRVANLRRRSWQYALFPARSDQGRQL